MNYKEYKGVIIRDDPTYTKTDKDMVRDCLKHYDKFELDENSVVLDLGVHCGGFAAMSKTAGVSYYHGIEALESNYECALQNIPEFGYIEHAAVSASHEDEITFYIRSSKQFSCSATVKPSKITKALKQVSVKNVNIHNILKGADWTHIKIDIEGAEQDFLDEHFQLPKTVQQISLEVHKEEFCLHYERNIHRYLLNQGFQLKVCYPNWGFANKESEIKYIFGEEYKGALFGSDLFYERI